MGFSEASEGVGPSYLASVPHGTSWRAIPIRTVDLPCCSLLIFTYYLFFLTVKYNPLRKEHKNMDLHSLLHGKHLAPLRAEDSAAPLQLQPPRGEEPSPSLGFYGAASSPLFRFAVCTPSLGWQCLLHPALPVALLCVVRAALVCPFSVLYSIPPWADGLFCC